MATAVEPPSDGPLPAPVALSTAGRPGCRHTSPATPRSAASSAALRSCGSGQAQVDPGHGVVFAQQVAFDFGEAVLLGEAQSVRVGSQDHGLDDLGVQRAGLAQGTLVEAGAEAAAAVLRQDAGDDCGGRAVVAGGRAPGAAADQGVAEVGDLGWWSGL